jgi:hypothetical protein
MTMPIADAPRRTRTGVLFTNRLVRPDNRCNAVPGLFDARCAVLVAFLADVAETADLIFFRVELMRPVRCHDRARVHMRVSRRLTGPIRNHPVTP